PPPPFSTLFPYPTLFRSFLLRVLERLDLASSEYLADNGGLINVLTAAEMLEEDAAADREDRRARSGHVSSASARAFLKLPTGDRSEEHTSELQSLTKLAC